MTHAPGNVSMREEPGRAKEKGEEAGSNRRPAMVRGGGAPDGPRPAAVYRIGDAEARRLFLRFAPRAFAGICETREGAVLWPG